MSRFGGWPATLQLDYGNPALQDAMVAELERIAHQCDGVRCDMAMLVLPQVLEKTWGSPDPRSGPGPPRPSAPRSTGTSNGPFSRLVAVNFAAHWGQCYVTMPVCDHAVA
jgi:hypothetical protein